MSKRICELGTVHWISEHTGEHSQTNMPILIPRTNRPSLLSIRESPLINNHRDNEAG